MRPIFNITKNRASTVAGLIENYETIAEVIEAAENAEGSALEENEKYLDSIDGKVQQFTNTVQKFWASFKADGLIKGVVDAGTTLLDLITQITDKAGLLGTIGIGAGAFTGFKNVGVA